MIINGNPINDIYRTRSVYTVIKGGKIYSSMQLKNEAKVKLGPEGPIQ